MKEEENENEDREKYQLPPPDHQGLIYRAWKDLQR